MSNNNSPPEKPPNLPLNVNTLFTGGFDCYDSLSAFLNYSGQCWSDSASVFLLFSHGLGPLLQSIFNTHKTQELADIYIDWCLKNQEAIQTVATIYSRNPLTLPELTKYIDYSSQYLKCLHQRYLNTIMKSNTSYKKLLTSASLAFQNPANPHRPNLPTNAAYCSKKDKQLSLCQEANGKYMSLLLSKRSLFDESFFPSSHTLITRKYSFLKENNTSKTFLPESKYQGNDIRIFSLCMDIYIQFLNSFQKLQISTPTLPTADAAYPLSFSYNRIKRYVNYTSAESDLSVPVLKFIKSIAPVSDKIYSMICKFEYITPKFSTMTDLPNPFLETSYYSSFFDSSYIIEFNPNEFHAVTFLQCGKNDTYVYDDNLSDLKRIQWKELLTLHNDSDEGVYYIYIHWKTTHIQSILQMLEEHLTPEKPDAERLKGLLLHVLNKKPIFIGLDVFTKTLLLLFENHVDAPIKFKYPLSYVPFSLFYILSLTKSTVYTLSDINAVLSEMPFTDPSTKTMYGGKRKSSKLSHKSRKVRKTKKL
jgi:hypothetical protein